MPLKSLKAYLQHNRNDIIQKIRDRWLQQPWSPYQDFILRTDEGQRRVRIWISLLLDALGENQEEFLNDQHRVGYARAFKKLRLENVIKNIPFFMDVLWEILPEALAEKELQSADLYGEMQELTALLFENYKIIAASYVNTREEIINEKVLQLQALFDFTREIITLSNMEDVVKLLLNKTITLFVVEQGYLALYRNHRLQEIYCHPERKEADEIIPIIEDTWNEGVPLFLDEEGAVYRDIDQFKLKRMVTIPIRIHGRCHGVIALGTRMRGFRFTKKELDFIYQFVHIMAVALENIYMMGKIEQSRNELHLLTTKMITIQEEERRRLAGDIHDTIAQALTGISYKIQFCKELFKKTPELLVEQFDILLETVNRTVGQSRELISSLRPDLMDTVGLVPALKRHIGNFEQETGIRVETRLPQNVQLSSEASICLFRVAQEALMNVYKHAGTKSVEVTLKKEDRDVILIVADNGKGFDIIQGFPWIKDQDKLGLLSMKERVETVGGSFAIHSEIHKGCRIKAKIPSRTEVSHLAQD